MGLRPIYPLRSSCMVQYIFDQSALLQYIQYIKLVKNDVKAFEIWQRKIHSKSLVSPNFDLKLIAEECLILLDGDLFFYFLLFKLITSPLKHKHVFYLNFIVLSIFLFFKKTKRQKTKFGIIVDLIIEIFKKNF